MPKNRRIIFFVLPMVLFLFLSQISCNRQLSAQEILNHSLSSMAQVTSYRLGTNVTWTYDIVGGSAPSESIVTWTGDRLIDISEKTMHKSMNQDITHTPGNKVDWTMETYFSQGNAYEKVTTTSGAQSNAYNAWFKTKLTDDGWTSDNQISLLINLLKSSATSILSGSENLSGNDCYVLTIQPSSEAIAEWTHNQFQGYGAMDLSTGPALLGIDNYVKNYKSGTFKVWIAKDNYLVLKADIEPNFEATAAVLGATPGSPGYIGFSKITSSFNGQLNFSFYNQPVSIQVPSEVLSATER